MTRVSLVHMRASGASDAGGRKKKTLKRKEKCMQRQKRGGGTGPANVCVAPRTGRSVRDDAHGGLPRSLGPRGGGGWGGRSIRRALKVYCSVFL